MLLLFYGFWAIFAAIVMVIDRSARTREDFTPSPGGYFILAAITPFLVLPVYFYTARRSSTTGVRLLAMLAGVGLTFVCSFLAAWPTTWFAVLMSAIV